MFVLGREVMREAKATASRAEEEEGGRETGP
jgi:hypothetical protein